MQLLLGIDCSPAGSSLLSGHPERRRARSRPGRCRRPRGRAGGVPPRRPAPLHCAWALPAGWPCCSPSSQRRGGGGPGAQRTAPRWPWPWGDRRWVRRRGAMRGLQRPGAAPGRGELLGYGGVRCPGCRAGERRGAAPGGHCGGGRWYEAGGAAGPRGSRRLCPFPGPRVPRQTFSPRFGAAALCCGGAGPGGGQLLPEPFSVRRAGRRGDPAGGPRAAPAGAGAALRALPRAFLPRRSPWMDKSAVRRAVPRTGWAAGRAGKCPQPLGKGFERSAAAGSGRGNFGVKA